MGSASIIIAFLAGILSAGALAFMLLKRLKREQEERFTERCRIAEREQALKLEEFQNRHQLAFEKRKAELEQDHKSREIEVRGREEEAVSVLMSAEKDRDLLDKRRAELDDRYAAIERAEDRLRESLSQYRLKLQEAAQLTVEAAQEQLLQMARIECEDEIRAFKDELLNRSEKEVEEEARRTLLACMQRLSSVPHEDITATLVTLPSEDMKGRIIGREGRNIKSFESMTSIRCAGRRRGWPLNH